MPGRFARGVSRAMEELGCTGLVGRGSTSSAVVNQASREAVVLTLRASILTPARSACLKRLVIWAVGKAHILKLVTLVRCRPALAFRTSFFQVRSCGVMSPRVALYLAFRWESGLVSPKCAA